MSEPYGVEAGDWQHEDMRGTEDGRVYYLSPSTEYRITIEEWDASDAYRTRWLVKIHENVDEFGWRMLGTGVMNYSTLDEAAERASAVIRDIERVDDVQSLEYVNGYER